MIELTDPNHVAILRVVAQKRDNRSSLADGLPTVVAGTYHEQTRTTHEDQPAIRYELTYTKSMNGPWNRVEGLVTRSKTHIFNALCGVSVSSSGGPRSTDTPHPKNAKPTTVDWTPTIEQAATQIVESFTLE